MGDEQIKKNTQDITEIKGTLREFKFVIENNTKVIGEFKQIYTDEGKENRKFMDNVRQHFEKISGQDREIFRMQQDLNKHDEDDKKIHEDLNTIVDGIKTAVSKNQTKNAVALTKLTTSFKTWAVIGAAVTSIITSVFAALIINLLV